MDILKKVPAPYRIAVYVGTVVFGVASLALGVLVPETFGKLVTSLQAIISLIAGVLALGNITPSK
jgi:hypothetical protein